MNFAVALVVAGVLAPLVALRRRRWALPTALVVLAAGLAFDLGAVLDLGGLAGALERMRLPGPDDLTGEGRVLLLGVLVWCGPAADLVVRRALDATGLPAVEEAAAAGLRAGRWIGRLERWLLVVCVAGGMPALAVLPVGGKALFRYAEVVADARAEAPRIEPANGEGGPPLTRGSLIDYVIVGSLASWVQAIALALLVGNG